MLNKYFGGNVPAETAFNQPALEKLRQGLIARVNGLHEAVTARIVEFDLDGALEAIWLLVREANQFVNESAPFKLAKDPARANDLAASMHAITEVVHALACALTPFLPDATAASGGQLNVKLTDKLPDALKWGRLKAGHKIGTPAPLFVRLDVKVEA
jgi:methionyl-tRNA synthetase